ncbi:hypothetical protein DFH07DRAFT_756471, partial [Mycena maculata]
RSSPVHLFHVKAHSGNHHNDAADAAAKQGAAMDLASEDYVSCRAPAPPPCVDIATGIQKVVCNIPESPAQQAPIPSQTPEVHSSGRTHRGRAQHCATLRANRKRLTDASSNSAAFWKVYWSLADPKPRAPAVSLSDLASCFQSQMNAPDPPPRI